MPIEELLMWIMETHWESYYVMSKCIDLSLKCIM